MWDLGIGLGKVGLEIIDSLEALDFPTSTFEAKAQDESLSKGKDGGRPYFCLFNRDPLLALASMLD